jgi:HEPN domain-containing protein
MKITDSHINRFVTNSFRDVADKDYIAARICYRYGLHHQFLWFGQQAVEKYLKGILLYNRVDTRKLRHNLREACAAVLSIPDIDFDFPDDAREFIEYLDDQGTNRYLEYPYYLPDDAGLQLDRTVWFVRRYCEYLRRTRENPDGTEHSLLSAAVARIQSEWTLEHPNKFNLFGGFLEQVLRDKKSGLRSQLVWKNFYYGTYRKQVIWGYPSYSLVGNPIHFMHPEVFDELSHLVQFSSDVKQFFREHGDGR